jgi:hypothetical protein
MRSLWLCVLFACSSGGSSSDHNKACTDVSSARCTRLMTCSPSVFSRRFSSLAQCVMGHTQVCLNSFAASQNSNSDDRLEACAAALPTQDCTTFLADVTVGPCQPSPGPRADGQPCAFAGQCSSAYCNIPAGSNCGGCAAQPKAGDACGDCGTLGLVCANGTCVAPLAAGASCDRMTAPCVSGTVCVGGGATTMGSCRAQATTAGAACDARRRTAPDCSRDADLYCATGGTCMTAASAGQGMMCGQINGVLTLCASGGCFGQMAGMPGTCASPAPDGMPCDSVNGPGCQLPARCVGSSSDAGTSGTCQLAGATSC